MGEKEKGKNMKDHSREHLANERTFLAWIRTSIGIMAFGFVLERFSFFLRKLVFLEKTGFFEDRGRTLGPKAGKALRLFNTPGYSAVLGIVFVVFGILLAFFAFVRYRKVGKEIDEQKYYPKTSLNIALTAFVLTTGILLLAYLIKSV